MLHTKTYYIGGTIAIAIAISTFSQVQALYRNFTAVDNNTKLGQLLFLQVKGMNLT
jgi:hypothetical protein